LRISFLAARLGDRVLNLGSFPTGTGEERFWGRSSPTAGGPVISDYSAVPGTVLNHDVRHAANVRRKRSATKTPHPEVGHGYHWF